MTAIKVQPDTVWVKRPVDIRFTADYDMKPEFFWKEVAEAAKNGIRKWMLVNKRDEFLDKEPIKIKLSPFQGNSDKLDAALKEGKPINYLDRMYLEGKRDYVIRVWFKSPADWVLKPEYIERPQGREGFMEKEKLQKPVREMVEKYESKVLDAVKE